MQLRLGSKGEPVRVLQEMLNAVGARVEREGPAGTELVALTLDGDFGARTESAVMAFQARHGLLVDGVVGPITFARLQHDYDTTLSGVHSPSFDADFGTGERLTFTRVPADAYQQGYGQLWLRSDVAERYLTVLAKARAAGAKLTSSGGKRDLFAPVSAGRSATSFHYTGRALDLFLYSGMVNAEKDPYVVVREAPRQYRVYARCNAVSADATHLDNVVTYRKRSGSTSVDGSFLDLTKLFSEVGFRPILARPSFEQGGDMIGAEWWHFQDETGLVKGATTFGSELLRVYAEATLKSAPPWKYRDHVFGVNWN